MLDFIRSTLWLVSYSVLLLAAGALMGKPLYAWVSKKMPWNK